MSDITLSTTRGRQKDKREQAIRMYARKWEGMEGRRKEGIKSKRSPRGGRKIERMYAQEISTSPEKRRSPFLLFIMNLFNFKEDFA